jgi:hypothetical protein
VEGAGPCFEVDVTDGIADSAEFETLFECLNGTGLLDPLRPLVFWLAESDAVDDVLTLASEAMGDFDVAGGLEIASRLLGDEDDPLGRVLGLYVEIYDRDLIPRFLALGRETFDAMADCEDRSGALADAEVAACSLPRLALWLLDTEVPDSALGILDEVRAHEAELGEDPEGASLAELGGILVETSTRAGHPRNQVLDLLAFFLDDGGDPGQSPLERLLPHLRYLLSDDLDGDGASAEAGDPDPTDDDLVATIADHFARLYRDGRLQALPEQLLVLNTFDSEGNEVGWEGRSIMDELMDVMGSLGGDASMLEQEFTLPGSSTPTTLLELALDTLDDLYVNEADIDEMVETLRDMVENQLCAGTASTELCALMEDVLPPLSAAVRTGVGDLLLPVAWAAHQTLDFDRVFDLLDLALELDLLGRVEFFSRISLEHGMLEDTLALFPVFVHVERGTLSRAGRDGLALLRFFLSEQVYDARFPERRVVPLLVPRELLLRLLSPEYPDADLDRVLWTLGSLLGEEEGPLSAASLSALLDELAEAVDAEPIDPMATARRLLENEALWSAALRLGADPVLMDLLCPAPDRRGATWFLRDLITRGLLGRVLDVVAAILEELDAGPEAGKETD